MSLVPRIENSEKKDHEVPDVTENGMVWKSPSMAIFCGGTGSGKTNCLLAAVGCCAVMCCALLPRLLLLSSGLRYSAVLCSGCAVLCSALLCCVLRPFTVAIVLVLLLMALLCSTLVLLHCYNSLHFYI